MECIICDESMFHLFYEPMSMGCKCQQRLCQRCYKVGDVTKCPTCRKFKKQPRVDRKLLRKEWKQGDLMKCLGCEKEVYTRYLHRHEMRCAKYRDAMQAVLEEDLRMRRVQTERNEKSMAEMEARLDMQADTIEELEDHVEELEQRNRAQEEERQLYVAENGRLLRSLEGCMGPMFTNVRSLEAIYSRISQTACSLRASRVHHQVLRRQHLVSSSAASFQTPLSSLEAAIQPRGAGAGAASASASAQEEEEEKEEEGGGLQVQPPSPSRRLTLPPIRLRSQSTPEREEGEVVSGDESSDSSFV